MQFVGEWEFEGLAASQSGAEPERLQGTEVVRPVGAFWIQGISLHTLPDGTQVPNQLTLGYDADADRFIGTFISGMMAQLWLYTGSLDPEGRVLTLSTEGPDFYNPGHSKPYLDVHEWVSDDLRILRSLVQTEDGGWTEFMRAEYHRVG